jgi:hypothetical protein
MATYTPKEKLLTAKQLCEWWGITTDQLDKLRRERALPCVQLSRGNYLFKESLLVEWYDAEIGTLGLG